MTLATIVLNTVQGQKTLELTCPSFQSQYTSLTKRVQNIQANKLFTSPSSHKKRRLDKNVTFSAKRDSTYETAMLIWAAANNEVKVVESFMDETDLMLSTPEEKCNELKNLFGINEPILDSTSNKPELISKLKARSISTAKSLIESPKTNLNARDSDGSTALMWSAKLGQTEIVDVLLNKHRTDVYLCDIYGNTAFKIAGISENDSIAFSILSEVEKRSRKERLKQKKQSTSSKMGKIPFLKKLLNFTY